MNRFALGLLLIIFVSMACSRKAVTRNPHVDTLVVYFSPAFIASSKVTILRFSDSSIIDLKLFSNDSARNIYAKSIKTENKQTDSLWRILNVYKFEKWDKPMLDGMTVYGKFKNGTSHEFSLWSGGRNNDKLINSIYALLGKSFNDKQIENYLKQIKEY